MKLRNIFNRLSTKSKVATGALVALAILAVPAAVMAGFGPNGAGRTIFDWSNPAERQGALDGPRFNSFINTNVYGDERAFVDAKECTVTGAACYQNGVAGGYLDQQPVVAGKEYIVRAYVHNNANPSINDDVTTAAPMDGKGVAKNTRIRFELPQTDGLANGFTAQARIIADNALPQEVYDTVDFRNNNSKFNVSYVPGSAYIFNASHPAGLNLSDNIMSTNGTLIGDDQMDGNYPGCFEFSSFVVIRVKVTAPDLDVQKFVSTVEMPKMTDVSESVSVKRGDTIHWRINYKNTGTHFASDVTIRDEMPKGLTVVPGSIKLTTALGTETLPDTALTSGGANVGDYSPEGNGVIRFSTKVETAPEVCELTNIAFGRATEIPEVSDDASIRITDCSPITPVYSCDALNITNVKDWTFRFSADTTALGGATVKNYHFNFGDKSEVLLTDKATVEHTYKKAGKYSPSVKVTFTVDGKDVTVDGKNCVKTLEIKDTPKTPETPETLPDTGAGSIAGILASVTIAGSLAHRKMTLRRR